MKSLYKRIAMLSAGLFGLICLLTTADTFSQDRYLPPTVQDCLGAIPVCQPVYSTTNSYVGHGNVYPEIHNNSVCPFAWMVKRTMFFTS